MILPQKLTLDNMQNRWASIINPLLSNPLNNSSLLKNIELQTGDNVINHLLGRTLQGWIIVDIQGVADIYRSMPLNDQTLTLNSSAAVTISLGVF
jgi:hypothetical protein